MNTEIRRKFELGQMSEEEEEIYKAGFDAALTKMKYVFEDEWMKE